MAPFFTLFSGRTLVVLFWCLLTVVQTFGQAEGSLDPTFITGTGPNNDVWATATQPDGKILIAGNFTSYNGTPINRIARLNPDGSLDTTFNPGAGADWNILALAIQPDGKILIGGVFSTVDGVSRQGIARLNANGSLDLGFTSGLAAGLTGGAPQTILVQPDGKIIVTGHFTHYSGIPRGSIVRLHPDGTLDTSFANNPGTTSYIFRALLLPDGKLMIGGQFSYYDGRMVGMIARLNPDASLDTTFNANFGFGIGSNGGIHAMVRQPDGKIIIGGIMIHYNLVPRNRIARLYPDGAIDSTFNPGYGANAAVRSLDLQVDGKIMVGGDFTEFDSTSTPRLVRLLSNGEIDTTFEVGSGADAIVYSTVVQPNGNLVVGGNFTTYKGTAANKLMRLLGTPVPQPAVTTGAVTLSGFCPGDSVQIAYSASGQFNPNNVFAAVLSDSSGSFALPLTLGGVYGIGSGVISGIIPPGITGGTGYRVKVVASDPAISGSDNGQDLLLFTPPSVAISAPATGICQSQSLALSASGADSYLWNTGQTTHAIVVSPAVSTAYTVTGTSANGCHATAIQQVQVTPLIHATSATVCQGATITLSATAAPSPTFSWSGPGNFTSTAQYPQVANITPALAGNYTVVGPGNGCSDTAVVTVTVLPKPVIVASSDSILPGQLVTLAVSNALPGFTYSWLGSNLNQIIGDTVTANPVSVIPFRYIVRAMYGQCILRDTIYLELDQNPNFQLGNWNWVVSGGSANGRFAQAHNSIGGLGKPSSGTETGVAIAALPDGTTTTLARFKGTATFGTATLTSLGDEDMAILKTDAQGQVQWVQQAGSPASERATAIGSDAAGNAYVYGSYSGTISFGTNQHTATGPEAAFLAKYNATGAVIWAQTTSGAGQVQAGKLSTDAQGNTTITGSFTGTVGIGTFTLISTGNSDIFVARYNAAGTVIWAKQFGGTSSDAGVSVATDAAGNTYLTGTFSGGMTLGTTQFFAGNALGQFYCKLSPAGDVIWADSVGLATSATDAPAVAADGNGFTYLAGNFSGTLQLGNDTLISNGSTNVYLAYYHNSGLLLWAKRAGGLGADRVQAIALDQEGLCHLTGSYTGYARFGGHGLSGTNNAEIFVAKYDIGGNCMWARKASGIAADEGCAIAVDADGNSYITGSFGHYAGFGPNLVAQSQGYADVFIARLDHIQALQTEDQVDTASLLPVYPNPFQKGFSVTIPEGNVGQAQVRLYNVLGALVLHQDVSVSEGQAMFAIQPQANLPKGMYLLRVELGGDSYCVRLIKQ